MTPLIFPEDLSEQKKMLHQRMLENSEKRFLCSTTNPPEFAGVGFIKSYNCKTDATIEAYKTTNQGKEVIVHFDNGIVKKGKMINRLAMDGNTFVEDLFSKVKAKGAILHQRHFENLEDVLSLEEPVIVNCTSLGSRRLFNDQEFIPLRGHLIHFKPQKGIDFLFFQNVPSSPTFWVSLYPWHDRFILGGVYEQGVEDTTVNWDVVKTMIENAEKCFSEKVL